MFCLLFFRDPLLRKGVRVVEGVDLERLYGSFLPSRVRIPLFPLPFPKIEKINLFFQFILASLAPKQSFGDKF